MTDRELMQQALDALEQFCTYNAMLQPLETRDALRARLADEMPTKIFGPNLEEILNAAGFFKKKEWVGLTDEEVSKTIGDVIGFNSCVGWEEEFTRAIEAKLKEKNT
jgi:hypothetical protein